MNKRQLSLVIVVSVISICGLVVSQLRWISNAMDLSEEQYDHRVTLALNEVIEILSSSTESSRGCTNTTCEYYDPETSHLEHVINWAFLERTIQSVFRNYDLLEEYEYNLINIDRDQEEASAIYSNKIALKPHDNCTSWQAENYQLGVFFPGKQQYLLRDMAVWLMLPGVLLIVVALVLYYIIYRFMEQKKVAEIKNDFINNMTHEFKTPLSTISLATEVLLKSAPGAARERIRHYSKIIHEENNRMKLQVEYILKMALLQRNRFKLKLACKDIHELITGAMDHLCLEQFEKSVNIRYSLQAAEPTAFVDPMHFTNIITNLVSNACKYSGEQVDIHIRTANLNGGISVVVEDNGIGIRQEHLPHIFDKFYRVPTGNLHNAKGFGLGLYYVKEMMKAHKGDIRVKSEYNKGTRFELHLSSLEKN